MGFSQKRYLILFGLVAVIMSSSLSAAGVYKFNAEERTRIVKSIEKIISTKVHESAKDQVWIEDDHAIEIDQSIYVPVIFGPKPGLYPDGEHSSGEAVLEFAKLRKDGSNWSYEMSYNKITHSRPIDSIMAIAYRSIPGRDNMIIVIYACSFGAGAGREIDIGFYKPSNQGVCTYDKSLSEWSMKKISGEPTIGKIIKILKKYPAN